MMLSRQMIACVVIAVAIGVIAFRKDQKEIRRLTSLTGDALKEAVDLKLKAKPTPKTDGEQGEAPEAEPAEAADAAAEAGEAAAAYAPEAGEETGEETATAAAAAPEAVEEAAAAAAPEADGKNADENAHAAAQTVAKADDTEVASAVKTPVADEPKFSSRNMGHTTKAAVVEHTPEESPDSDEPKREEKPAYTGPHNGDWAAARPGHTTKAAVVEHTPEESPAPTKRQNTDSKAGNKDKSKEKTPPKKDESNEKPAPIKQRGDWVKEKDAEAKSGGVRSAVSATLLVLALALVMQ